MSPRDVIKDAPILVFFWYIAGILVIHKRKSSCLFCFYAMEKLWTCLKKVNHNSQRSIFLSWKFALCLHVYEHKEENNLRVMFQAMIPVVHRSYKERLCFARGIFLLLIKWGSPAKATKAGKAGEAKKIIGGKANEISGVYCESDGTRNPCLLNI